MRVIEAIIWILGTAVAVWLSLVTLVMLYIFVYGGIVSLKQYWKELGE